MSRKASKKKTEVITESTVDTYLPQGDESLLATVLQFLKELDFRSDDVHTWTDENDCERFRIRSGVHMDNGDFAVLICGNVRLRTLIVYTISPTGAPRQRRAEVAELVTRANWALLHGNFEMDYRDGEVRFKMSMEFDGTPMNFSLMRYLLWTGWGLVNDYQPALEAVIVGEATPEEAEQQVQSGGSGV